ncbi:hypothetical protein [Pseudoalteromonas sp. NBT06-2]|uniref:DUF3108 domain-containing protein n=1 Tax=Pseudoalteromonas sp. NBT06-2 TaxID=2025950 RepID=UPI001140DA1F|nr:hypothetical protein [Pseudoalteromonas sp. NBT06-2]
MEVNFEKTIKYLISLSVLVSFFSFATPRVEDVLGRDFHNEYILYIGGGPVPYDGIAAYHFMLGEENGDQVYRAFHYPVNPNKDVMDWFDNDILELNTLRPLYKKHPGGEINYDYSVPGEVSLTFINDSGKVKKKIKTDSHNYVTSGPGLMALVGHLPLKLGFEALFSTLSTQFPYGPSYDVDVIEYIVKVVGEESINVRNTIKDSYIVELAPLDETEKRGIYMKAWISKDAPNALLQSVYASSAQRKVVEKNYADRLMKVKNAVKIQSIFKAPKKT